MYQEHNITKITTWPEALVPKIETTLPAFLLNRFWRTLEILCMNEIRTLLSIHCMLPRYSEIELHVNVTRRKLTCGTTSTTRTCTSECILTTICTGTLVLQKKYLKNKSMTCYFDTIFTDRKKKGVNSLFPVFYYPKDFTIDDTQENLPRGSQYLE